MRSCRQALIICALLLLGSQHASAQATQPAEYAVEDPKDPKTIDWGQVMRTRIKPLTRARGERWPLVFWENVPYTVQDAQVYKDLLARGIVPTVQLDAKMIPVAKAIQDAGGPVVMIQGQGGTFGYDLAGDPSKWAHQLPADYKGSKASLHACVNIFTGWKIKGDEIRQTFEAYKAAGVTVNAVWMDWEGEPLWLDEESYEQAKVCPRCRATLPPGVFDSYEAYNHYGRKLAMDVFGAYLALPAAEVFPGVSTSSWGVISSTPDNPIHNWHAGYAPPCQPVGFTATNPVAYGDDDYFNETLGENNAGGRLAKKILTDKIKPNHEEVDEAYMHVLLRHVSGNQQNIETQSPWIRSVPWVARWCPDDMNANMPVMSRERYREALRHVWLRGAVAMQVFNPTRPGFSSLVIAEVEDARAVYDESLAWSDYILHGRCMNLEIPKEDFNGVIWSGMRLTDTAVVRTFKQGGGTGTVTITPWAPSSAAKVELKADGNGTTYFLKLKDGKIEVKEGGGL